MSSKNEGFEWCKIPPEYDRRFIFKVVASQATETDHTKDMTLPESSRKIRVYSNEERRIAARSLALRHIDINHDFNKIIPNAIVLDAQFVEPDKIECICYIPDEEIIKQLRANKFNGVSIEEMNREDVPIGDNKVDVRGITYYGLALVKPPFQAGDSLTSISPMFEGILSISKLEFLVPIDSIKGEPFADYANFDACVVDQQSKGKDIESAKNICGALQAKAEAEKPKKEAQVIAPAKPVEEPKKEPEKKPEPTKEEILVTVEKRVKELEDTVTRMQKTVAESDKKTKEAFEKGKKEGKSEVIKKVEEVIPSVLVQRQGSYAVNRLVVDLKKKLREESA